MFNRSTKLTALLVAAASVASMTPVMAAEKLNQKDGKVYNAVAYDKGKYAYYGYKDSDNDDTGIWYNSGSGKDKPVEDLEEYEIQEKYGSKYVYVTEEGNNDEYLVDLSTGKIAEDESAETKAEYTKGNLVSKLKKTERYNTFADKKDNRDYEENVRIKRLFTNQFGDVWYQYVATTDANIKSDFLAENGIASTTNAAIKVSFGDKNGLTYTGFTDEKGKYIDASYLANLKIYNERKHKATEIKKFGYLYKDEALQANLKSIKPLAQDKDNLYVLTTVEVIYYNEKGKGSGEYDFDDPKPPITQKFIQKISKAQGTDVDEAYVPKNVDSYQVEITDNDNKKSSDTIYEGKDDSYKVNNVLEDPTAKFAVNSGNLYATIMDSNTKAHVYKLKLGKAKVKVLDNVFEGREAIDTKLVTVDKDSDHDVESGKAVSIDVNGNTWILDNGKVFMFDKDEFKQVYSTDKSYDSLDVYDKDSLIAWNEDKESYTTVQEGKAQTVSDAKLIDPNLIDKTTIAPAHTPGWEKQANGVDWKFYDAAGNEAAGWIFVGNAWYYMDPATKLMKTGWVQPNGAGTTWYYLTESGAMKTGWLNLSGTWYYLDGSGAMKTGWFQDYTGTWYYCYGDGHMASNTYVDGYWLNGSGAWVK